VRERCREKEKRVFSLREAKVSAIKRKIQRDERPEAREKRGKSSVASILCHEC